MMGKPHSPKQCSNHEQWSFPLSRGEKLCTVAVRSHRKSLTERDAVRGEGL